MVKKASRVAKVQKRESRRLQYEREEAAMLSFLDECRVCMAPNDWERHFDEARQSARETIHIVEHLVFVLAATQMPIPPRLRRSIDAMLDSLNMDRGNCRWEHLRRLNYGKYWKTQYGYT
jgi:methionyl-tRNA synthetase